MQYETEFLFLNEMVRGGTDCTLPHAADLLRLNFDYDERQSHKVAGAWMLWLSEDANNKNL
jgi:hypothetical protein